MRMAQRGMGVWRAAWGALVRGGLLALIAGVLLCGCSFGDPPTCIEQSTEYIQELDDLTMRSLDAVELADSTPRLSLGPVISDLQEIKREVAALDAPECASQVQRAAEKLMEQSVTTYLAFVSEEEDEVVAAEYDKMSEYAGAYLTARQELVDEAK